MLLFRAPLRALTATQVSELLLTDIPIATTNRSLTTPSSTDLAS